MFKILTVLFSLFCFGFCDYFCPSPSTVRITTNNACDTLIAGKKFNVGTVCFDVNQTHLIVQYNLSSTWKSTSFKLWVGPSREDFPQNSAGNPQNGLFPFKYTPLFPATFYSFALKLTNLSRWMSNTSYLCTPCDQGVLPLFVLAHADVKQYYSNGTVIQQQTSWLKGDPLTLSGGNWATMYQLEFVKKCGSDVVTTNPGDYKCDTALAYYNTTYSTCFSQYGLTRWGWTNGPYLPGTYQLTIIAAAGQCKLSNGYVVGTGTLVYTGSTATFQYSITVPGFMRSAHFYVGTNPMFTVNGSPSTAFGLFPYINSDLGQTTQYTFTATGLSGGYVYIIAHADTCVPVAQP